MNKTPVLALAAVVIASSTFAETRKFPHAQVFFPPEIHVDHGPFVYDQLEQFPHQVAVGDFIGTGMVLATNDGYSATLAVGEVIWGQATSSNITVQCVDKKTPTEFNLGGNYLVLAYTNDWWAGAYTNDLDDWVYEDGDITLLNLYDYNTPTSRPPSLAVFNDYRILRPRCSAISFDWINEGGTNYWDATRTFITNFIDIAKFQNSDEKAYKYISKVIHGEGPRLPRFLMVQTYVYYLERFDEDKGAALYGWE